MPRSLGNIIADSLELSLGYSDRLLSGVEPSNFARFAAPGGRAIESNHPAFIFGHLSLYPPRILGQLQRQDLSVSVPDAFEEVFSKDAKCQDDPGHSIYPDMPVVVECFQSGYGNAVRALREASDELLDGPNPQGGRMSELFPTMGSMHAFYAGGHMMMHLGQLSAWRRMQGLSPA